jgi:hypothetical protein
MDLKQAKSNRKNGFKTSKVIIKCAPIFFAFSMCLLAMFVVPAILKMGIFFVAIVQRISSL